MEAYLEDNRPTIDEICDSYDECTKECPVYELCHTEADKKEEQMPKSCKCILDTMVHKGAMTEKERDKILRNLKTEWIPVTERLPEEGERVLATHLGGLNPDRQVIEHIYENGKFTCGWDMDMDITSPTFGQRYMGDVIAWMPEPKPYKEGAEE